MSFANRIVSALFTALPSIFFFYQVVYRTTYKDYYWNSEVVVVLVLLGSSLFFGFVLPSLFRLFQMHAPLIWIMTSGILAVLLALFVLTLLNATPLCVGQDNGDGNNDLSMCMGYVFLAAIFFGSVYMFLLTISAFIGHWVLQMKNHLWH